MDLKRILPPLRTKFKALYWPFLKLQFGLLFILSFLGWLLILKFDVLPVHQMLSTFFIPILAAVLFYRLHLYPRFAIVHLWDDGKRDRGRMLYELLFVALLTAPLINSLSYLSKATFDLNPVGSASQIVHYPYEKYFLLDSLEVNIMSYFVHTKQYATGKNNSNLVFERYYVCPLKNTTNVWLGVRYMESSSNNRDNSGKQADFSQFKLDSDNTFRKLQVSKVQYFEKVPEHSGDMGGFLSAIHEKLPAVNLRDQIILNPVFEDFETRSDKNFFWLWVTLLASCTGGLIMCLAPKLKRGALRRAPKPLPTIWDYFRRFQPPPNLRATTALMGLMLLYYLWTLLTSPYTSLMSGNAYTTGALQLIHLQRGEYWRLLTYTFVPQNLAQFGLNMLGIFFCGMVLERRIGPLKLVLSYVFCGIIAVFMGSTWYNNTAIVPSSGAVFGLWGMVLAFNIRKVFPQEERDYHWQVWSIFVGIPLLICWVLMSTTGIACISGIMSGLLLGWVMNPKNKD